MLSVVIPVRNERDAFPKIFAKVLAVDVEKEIIIIDNCSTDGTVEMLRDIDHAGVRVVFQTHDQGKGASVRRGICEARGDLVIIQDADLEYDPEDYRTLLGVQRRENADVVFGVRRPVDLWRQPPHFAAANLGLSLLFSILYGQWVSDVATCYKLVRTEVLRSLDLRSSSFDLDFEIPAKLARSGRRIHQVPISYRPRTHAEGKKIRVGDGFQALSVLIRWRFAALGKRRAPRRP